jgi:tetratricopeptide (TPR) repeat protein
MRRLSFWKVALLLIAALPAAAQVPSPGQTAQAPADSGASATPSTTISPGVSVTAPRLDQSLPQLPPHEFLDCTGMGAAPQTGGHLSSAAPDYTQMMICEQRLVGEKHRVVVACINSDGKAQLPTVIQACTEALDAKVFEGNARYFLFANRAAAYFASGDRQHALDDYNEAVRLAPTNAEVFYNRGVFFAAQSDSDAALHDFDTAIGIDAKLVPALRQRARVYQVKGNLSGALADYSEAIRLQPKTAALWSERGYVSLRQHDYESAVKDEAEAIQLDPKLAKAYYLRGAAAAFGGLGKNASEDIKTAVSLDPSLAHYVTITGKTASLALPPL